MTKSRDLPPLLPLEYCRIDRAARMLECEVEDILHWGSINAIDIGVMVDMLPGFLLLDKECENYTALIDRLLHGFDDSIGEYSSFSINWESVDKKRNTDQGSLLAGCANGIWRLPSDEVLNIYSRGTVEIDIVILDPMPSEKSVPYCAFTSSCNVFLSASDLYVTKRDIERIHYSMANSKPLKKSHKSKAAEAKNRELVNDVMPQIRKALINEERWLDVLGVMAVLLYENTNDPRIRKGDNNINMAGIKDAVTDKAQKLGLSGERLANLNKDISTALKTLRYPPPKN